jgi:hypothetical protein
MESMGDSLMSSGASLMTFGKVDLEYGSLWFEWNGVDLSQFDSAVNGSKVSSSTWSVETFCGLTWIQGSVTIGGAVPANLTESLTVLPILKTPPTDNNLIIVDWLSWQATNTSWQLPFIMPRYVGISEFYGIFFGDDTVDDPQRICRASAGGTITVLGDAMADPVSMVNQQNGMELGLAIQGNAMLKGYLGERQTIADTSGLVSASGACAIGTATALGAGYTGINRFRRLRCYTVE